MSMQAASELTAKYGPITSKAVSQLVHFMPGGSLIAQMTEKLLDLVRSRANAEANWKARIDLNFNFDESEELRFDRFCHFLLTRMDDFLRLAIKWNDQAELASNLLGSLRESSGYRQAFFQLETLALQLEPMRNRIDRLCHFPEMRPLFQRAIRVSRSVEEVAAEPFTLAVIRWLRLQKAAQEKLLAGELAQAEDHFAQLSVDRPKSVVANVGCAAAQWAAKRFSHAEKSLKLAIQLQGPRPEPELAYLARAATRLILAAPKSDRSR